MENCESPNFDSPPRSNPQSPERLAPKHSIDRGRRPPRLVLPTPNATQFNSLSPYPYPPSRGSSKSPNPNGNAYGFTRKESQFIRDLKGFAKSGMGIGEKCTLWLYHKVSALSKKWFTHFSLTIVLAIYTAGGAAIFAAVEGRGEALTRLDGFKARYHLLTKLNNITFKWPNETINEKWEADVTEKIIEYEDTIIQGFVNNTLLDASLGGKNWRFFDAVVYCATIFTTIGYGHMAPATAAGQIITIVYAIIGIPLFLIALTDFGKLFTRGIKFLWSYVRRVYYTGSCRTVRKNAHMEDIFHGAQVMYEIATLRRPSIFTDIDPASLEDDPENPKLKDGSIAGIGSDTPTTPALSNFEIDDEFNLPISVAIFILVLYIFLGALMYCSLEGWNFFAAFYFVFISMSTIGFGEYVPKNPVCMIASIVYLVFGLALMSMCINVVQVKLTDTFKDASAKIGASIGLSVDEDDESITTVLPEVIEVPEVRVTEHDESENNVKQNGKNEKNEKNGKNGSKKEKKSSMKVKTKDEKEEGNKEESKENAKNGSKKAKKSSMKVKSKDEKDRSSDEDINENRPRTPKVRF